MQQKTKVALLLVAFLLCSGGFAFGASGGASIYACLSSSGTLTKVSKSLLKCPKGTSLITWNQIGPAGDLGPEGPMGPQGLQGPMGPQGLQGDKGTAANSYEVNVSYSLSGGEITTQWTSFNGKFIQINGALWPLVWGQGLYVPELGAFQSSPDLDFERMAYSGLGCSGDVHAFIGVRDRVTVQLEDGSFEQSNWTDNLPPVPLEGEIRLIRGSYYKVSNNLFERENVRSFRDENGFCRSGKPFSNLYSHVTYKESIVGYDDWGDPIYDQVVDQEFPIHFVRIELVDDLPEITSTSELIQDKSLVGEEDNNSEEPIVIEPTTFEKTQLISAGGRHACSIYKNAVKCWGANESGQIGIGKVSVSEIPSLVSMPGAVEVAAGLSHSCARTSVGEIYCWGSNSYGQLGDGTKVNRASPVKVLGITNAIQVSAGFKHTCAVLKDLSLTCWGSNTSGELKDGTLTDRPTPVKAQGISGIILVRTGQSHTCALTVQGRVNCWGASAAGQLGINLAGLGSVSDISTQGDFTCVLLQDTTVWCWGWNNGKQISPTASAVVVSPTKLTWATGSTQIDVGNDHLCVVSETLLVRCVGLNSAGQLGDGTLVSRSSPVIVSGITSPQLVAIGGAGWGNDFSCALEVDYELLCWGSNSAGQIAGSALSQNRAPYKVLVPISFN